MAAAEVSKTASEILAEQGLLAGDGKVLDEKQVAEKDEWQNNVAEEMAKWDEIEQMKHPMSEVVKVIDDISYSEALQHFQTQTYDPSSIATKVQQTKFAQMVRLLFGPRRLVKSLHEERNLLLHIAQVPLNDAEEVHCRVLQTIYKRLTGSTRNCPRYGAHWDVIGFQGSDPATDLRGAGFLALMHLLYVVTDNDAVRDAMYRLSTHPKQNFPFCLVSINITRIALQALREDKLSSLCNKRKQVVAVTNEFYVATFWHFFQIWKTQQKTMRDSGNVMKEIEKFALKNPSALLKEFQRSSRNHRLQPTLPPPIILRHLSTASSLSDTSLQSPPLTSQSLDVILQPLERDRSFSQSSDPRFASIEELSEASMLGTGDLS